MTDLAVLVERAKDYATRLRACEACVCRKSATRPIPGRGSLHAKVMVLGQAPGREEDREGRTLIGEIGAELRVWLAHLGLQNDQMVWYSNALKCQTPKGRAPKAGEIKICKTTWMAEELSLLPNLRAVITLGKPARNCLLGSKDAMRITEPTRADVQYGGRTLAVFALPFPTYYLRAPGERPYLLKVVLPEVKRALIELEIVS